MEEERGLTIRMYSYMFRRSGIIRNQRTQNQLPRKMSSLHMQRQRLEAKLADAHVQCTCSQAIPVLQQRCLHEIRGLTTGLCCKIDHIIIAVQDQVGLKGSTA